MEPTPTCERLIEEAARTLRRLAWRIRRGDLAAIAAYEEAYARHRRLLEECAAQRSPWEHVQLARHPGRPDGARLARTIFGELEPLRGDRARGEDLAVVTGVGRWRGRPVVVVASRRGTDRREARRYNYGMPTPAGFGKAQRALVLANRWGMPVVTLVDTPGAYPGLESELGAIAAAIARTLWWQARVRVPTLGIVTGEGGSGGALALAMGDRILMSAGAYFSVISPEACASILWRDGAKTPQAAAALRLLPEDLHTLGIVDEIVPEPPGGAHRAPQEAACLLREAIDRHLGELVRLDPEARLAARRHRYRRFGREHLHHHRPEPGREHTHAVAGPGA